MHQFAVIQHFLQYYHSFIHLSSFLKQLIVLMGLNFGVLFSIILKRTRKSRLTLFRQQLSKEAKQQLTLIQFPNKMIFSIIFILAIAVFMQWFAAELKSNLLEQSKKNIEKISPSRQVYQLHLWARAQNINDKPKLNEAESIMQHQSILANVRITINFIHFLQLIMLTTLLYHLNWKVIRTNKRENKITSTLYGKLGLITQTHRYHIKQKDKLQIWQLGQDRFTNTNYYYSVRIVSEDASWEVIRRSNIYSSRTTIISLAHHHSLPYTTKIKRKHIVSVNQQ